MSLSTFAAVSILAASLLQNDHLSLLHVGTAGHAFDHLGPYGEQAEAAVRSGANILYATGLGGFGYSGLPENLDVQRAHVAEYIAKAKKSGIQLAIGYMCATSVVGLRTFDAHFPDELRSQLRSPPAEWRQQDEKGKPLKSWYGGDYEPACMNHPDWRTYEKYVVRLQLEGGMDGIFFDNPTVHTDGCYCPHCMSQFAAFLRQRGLGAQEESLPGLRRLAKDRRREVLHFRSTIARDFLAEMRRHARTIKPDALITANNSLNDPRVLFSQTRTYGYSIHEMSKAEDYVVVEDMVSQPRVKDDGTVYEYGPTYRQLRAISHGKPVVAVSLADQDYHTPANLVRLAMAEAAAHGASYLSWPTWPEEHRQRMSQAIGPPAQFLRKHADLLNDAEPVADVVLILPVFGYLDSEHCRASEIAADLTRANIQYRVTTDEDLDVTTLDTRENTILVENTGLSGRVQKSLDEHNRDDVKIVVAQGDWMKDVIEKSGKSIEIKGPSTLRAVAWQKPSRLIVHVYNLNVRKVSSFEDVVTPARGAQLTVPIVGSRPTRIALFSADEGFEGYVQDLPRSLEKQADGRNISITLPTIHVSMIAVFDHDR